MRRLSGLLRPGCRLAAALMLSESAVVDLAVGGSLAHIAFCGEVEGGGFCVRTAQHLFGFPRWAVLQQSGPKQRTAGRYFIAGILLNLPAYKSITTRRERMS